ncbi:MAG: hypothetical protein C4K47_06775 [Candidatus Thorarchaeota archaeon]|nr:MAG: hypothetical protein C4K47_06775 [Candidatus Thorarchaeota archaeon]
MIVVTIELELQPIADAQRVLASVLPDNVPLPTGLRIESETLNGKLVFRIECNRALDSLRATIEDLLSAVDLSLRTLKSTE